MGRVRVRGGGRGDWPAGWGSWNSLQQIKCWKRYDGQRREIILCKSDLKGLVLTVEEVRRSLPPFSPSSMLLSFPSLPLLFHYFVSFHLIFTIFVPFIYHIFVFASNTVLLPYLKVCLSSYYFYYICSYSILSWLFFHIFRSFPSRIHFFLLSPNTPFPPPPPVSCRPALAPSSIQFLWPPARVLHWARGGRILGVSRRDTLPFAEYFINQGRVRLEISDLLNLEKSSKGLGRTAH